MEAKKAALDVHHEARRPEKGAFGTPRRDWRPKSRRAVVLVQIGLLILLLCKTSLRYLYDDQSSVRLIDAPEKSPHKAQILDVIQLATPIRFCTIHDECAIPLATTVLASRSFGNSYGQPFVGQYKPPAIDFDRVTWNLTVTSRGRQFDRLGTVSLGDVEIFRTSTAEPTSDGIVWTYVKDVTPFLVLLKQSHPLIFDLGNLVNDIYTGSFDVTLSATYYNVGSNATEPADGIIAVSKGFLGRPSHFTVPSEKASRNLTLPRNMKRAVVTLAATGQADEEFWWSNVLEQDSNRFPNAGTLPGLSPYREVHLLIDGLLAGIATPFPVIFTGGVVPGLWRPVVGIDAFDLKEDEIDITAWLSYLSDGLPHQFSISVVGLNTTAKGAEGFVNVIDNYWVVSAKVFFWLDQSSVGTIGTPPWVQDKDVYTNVSSAFSDDGVLQYHVNLRRRFELSSVVQTSIGPKYMRWVQTRDFTSYATYSEDGKHQKNCFEVFGRDSDKSGHFRDIHWHMNALQQYTTTNDTFSIAANLTHQKFEYVQGSGVLPDGRETFGTPAEATVQRLATVYGSATYLANTTSKTSSSYGSTRHEFEGLPYSRAVDTANGTIVHDKESDVNRTQRAASASELLDPHSDYAFREGRGRPTGSSFWS